MNIPPYPSTRSTADKWPRKRFKDRQRRRRNSRTARKETPND